MANTKISELPVLTTAIGADVLPIVDDVGGTPITKQIAVTDFFASVAVPIAINDTTQATTPLDGSLQTDGGLSVVGNAVIGGILNANVDSIHSIAGHQIGKGYIELGVDVEGSGADRACFLDFHAQNTPATDYNARIIREAGATGTWQFTNNTGGVQLTSGATAWTSASDRNKKRDFLKLTGGLDKLDKINPYYFNYKDDAENTPRRVGVIAQEIKEVLPEAVTEDKDGTLGVKYTELIPLLMSAIKEQQVMIEDLNARVEKLEVNGG